jgi:hypothetical protein
MKRNQKKKTGNFESKAQIMRAESASNLKHFGEYKAAYQTMNIRAVAMHLHSINYHPHK